MAINRVFINGNASALKTFLEGSGFFSSVTADQWNNITLAGKDGHVGALITSSGVTLYWDDNTGNHHLDITFGSYGGVTYAYSCSNGVMLAIHQNSNYNAYIMITENNLGELTFIVSYTSGTSSGTGHLTQCFAMAYGDEGALAHPSSSVYNPIIITPIVRNQTQITPFVTYAEEGTLSYTPNAGWFSASQNYGTGDGKILINGDLYITNGYWAIKD